MEASNLTSLDQDVDVGNGKRLHNLPYLTTKNVPRPEHLFVAYYEAVTQLPKRLLCLKYYQSPHGDQ